MPATAEEVSAEPPHPGFLLAHRFVPGTELTYAFSSSLHQTINIYGQELSFDITMTGTTHQVVADVDPATGVALIGQVGTSTWQRVEGEDRAEVSSRDQVWASVWRIDPRGQAVRRLAGEEALAPSLLQRTLNQVAESPQICAPFPLTGIAVGSRWKGAALLPLPGMRLPGDAVSTLVGTMTRKGRTTGIVRSDIRSESVQAYTDWMPDIWLPDMEVEGSSVGHLDMSLGVWRQTKVDLEAKLRGMDFDGLMRIRSQLSLTSARALPPGEAEAWRQRVQGFDLAIGQVYENNDPEAAATQIGSLAEKEAHTEWRNGLQLTVALLSKLAIDATSHVRDTSEEAMMLLDADQAALAENWNEAAARYEDLAQAYPDHEVAVPALAAAALIYARDLKQSADAAAANLLRVALCEARVEQAGKSNERVNAIYRLATAYAASDQPEKALESYGRFLEAALPETPAWRRALAMHRSARALATLGRTNEAAAQYRQICNLEADGEYCDKLKTKAGGKLEALAE